MFLHQIALVSTTLQVPFSQLTQVSAAIQKQVTRDLSPIWGVTATIDAFQHLEDIPIGYWPVVIMDEVPNAEGYHQDANGQPYAFVKYDLAWTVTASHECLEMLVDPYGNRLVPSDSVMANQGRVNFLIEICDPCEAFGYSVNGIPVCDFYTPNYFDPETAPGVRYSYTGSIQRPKDVLRGGYLSWYEPVTNKLWQAFNADGTLTLKSIEETRPPGQSLRVFVDGYTARTRQPQRSALVEQLGLSPRNRFGSSYEKNRLASLSAARNFETLL